MRSSARRGLTCVALILGAAAGRARAEGGRDAERWLAQAQVALAGVDSYRAIFHKQERVDGRLLPEETIQLKFKRPRLIHMRWIRKPFSGREVVYVEGRNENRIRVREGGLWGIIPVNLDPRGGLAMKGNRHSIVEAGIESLVARIAENVRRGKAAGELEVRESGEQVVYGRRTAQVAGIFPESGAGKYYCRRAVLSFDLELRVPIRAEIYDWDETLLESYGFEALVLNAGLSIADFAIGKP